MTSQTSTHIPGLDGVRAVALLLVLIGHFSPSESLQLALGSGDFGVVLFFVLSGFLITRILLVSRDSSVPFITKITFFYIRRSLRIFPLYFLVIGICVLLAYQPVVANLPRVLTYTANIAPPWQPQISTLGLASHLWSLSVEEQFYLIWPCLILLCPKNRCWQFVSLTVALVIAFRFYAAFFIQEYTVTFRWVVACMDSLGLGSLLAVLHHDRLTKQLKVLRRISICAICVFPIAVCWRMSLNIDAWYRPELWVGVLCFFTLALASVGLIDFVFMSQNQIKKIFEFRFVRWIGKVSYAAYLFHCFVPEMINVACSKANILAPSGLFAAFVYSVGTFALAGASWYVIERPFLRLKDYWQIDHVSERLAI